MGKFSDQREVPEGHPCWHLLPMLLRRENTFSHPCHHMLHSLHLGKLPPDKSLVLFSVATNGPPTWEKFPHFPVFVLLSLLPFIKRLKYLLLSRCVLWKHGHSRTRLLRDWRNFAKSRRRQKSWPTSCVNKTYSLETLQNCSTAHRNDFTSIHRYWRTTNQIYLYV